MRYALALTLLGALATAPAPTVAAPSAGTRPGYRTDIVFLRVMPASRAVALYERVIGRGPGARIVVPDAPQETGGRLIVYDSAERLGRFRELLAQLDVPSEADTRIYVRPVLYVRPTDLATRLLEVLREAGTGPLTLVPDERASQLVVRTTPATYARLDKLARRLDVPAGQGERDVRTAPNPPGGLP